MPIPVQRVAPWSGTPDQPAWLWPEDPGHTTWSRPEIVTLCGSTRFVETFNEYRKRLTHQGIIVLSIEIVTTQAYREDPQHVNHQNKEMLDLLHFEKIKISDRILVLNVDGYIGPSTQNEINFAHRIGVPVHYAYNR